MRAGTKQCTARLTADQHAAVQTHGTPDSQGFCVYPGHTGCVSIRTGSEKALAKAFNVEQVNPALFQQSLIKALTAL